MDRLHCNKGIQSLRYRSGSPTRVPQLGLTEVLRFTFYSVCVCVHGTMWLMGKLLGVLVLSFGTVMVRWVLCFPRVLWDPSSEMSLLKSSWGVDLHSRAGARLVASTPPAAHSLWRFWQCPCASSKVVSKAVGALNLDGSGADTIRSYRPVYLPGGPEKVKTGEASLWFPISLWASAGISFSRISTGLSGSQLGRPSALRLFPSRLSLYWLWRDIFHFCWLLVHFSVISVYLSQL